MFGGFAPPQFSEEEIEQFSKEASWSVKQFFVTAVVLYLSPFVTEAVLGSL
ncbi:mitochondrial outer membrane translocase complex, subunit Tom5 [Nemania sp. FL0916]|nr:mitochondrial outer membrane translocase complex, subunit Tom5 [Nemania sp. FL0916]